MGNRGLSIRYTRSLVFKLMNTCWLAGFQLPSSKQFRGFSIWALVVSDNLSVVRIVAT